MTTPPFGSLAWGRESASPPPGSVVVVPIGERPGTGDWDREKFTVVSPSELPPRVSTAELPPRDARDRRLASAGLRESTKGFDELDRDILYYTLSRHGAEAAHARFPKLPLPALKKAETALRNPR